MTPNLTLTLTLTLTPNPNADPDLEELLTELDVAGFVGVHLVGVAAGDVSSHRHGGVCEDKLGLVLAGL